MNVADFLKIFADDVAMNGGKLPEKYEAVVKTVTIPEPRRTKGKSLGKEEEERIINQTLNRILYGTVC